MEIDPLAPMAIKGRAKESSPEKRETLLNLINSNAASTLPDASFNPVTLGRVHRFASSLGEKQRPVLPG